MDDLVVNVMNGPVEALETEFPIRVEGYELIPDSGGPGQFRGGLGQRRKWRILAEESTVNLRTDRFKHASPGIFGARPAKPSRAVLNPGAPNERPLGSKAAGLRLRRDDLVVWELGGGGGYGDPRTRDPERVQRDVARGYVSVEAAHDAYGVAIKPDDLAVDAAATAALRRESPAR
jgi:N-methylhydantoinase B